MCKVTLVYLLCLLQSMAGEMDTAEARSLAQRRHRVDDDLRLFVILAWIQLPTVMYGGYALLGILTRKGAMTEFQISMFRAGHAHAGVLILMSLLYYIFLGLTDLSMTAKVIASIVILAGALAQSAGFFVHMRLGAPGQRSVGNTITTIGAALMVGASLFLSYALFAAW